MTLTMRLALTIWLLLSAAATYADEDVLVCFNYGCHSQAPASFSAPRMESLRQTLAAAHTPSEERTLLSHVIGSMYAWAGEQTPIHADRGGNFADSGMYGTMDCIDHSTTTTRFLKLLEQHHALRFHRVAAITRLGWIFQHFTATIAELPPAQALPTAALTIKTTDNAVQDSMPRFVVDSWYADNGQPARILPLAD
ncbi:MAG: hypothetical protein WA112_03210 [Rugosibacter sp.]|jgi:hypothetical protein|nr:hypothetical protein [Rugosibacter sp.]